MEKQKIVIISGATASGKTKFSIDFAKNNNGEIVGADSVQIYRNLNIGSGKIKPCEMSQIRHHMIDILEPNAEYSVSDYVSQAKSVINDIIDRGKLPIVVGGTGLYIKCLLEGHNFGEAEKNPELRERLNQQLQYYGKQYMHDLLRKIDPISADKISLNDAKRVIRALEIFELTGKPKSAAVKTFSSAFDYKMLVLDKSRDKLYLDINLRVDEMFEMGLLDEVRSLMEFKDCQSMQSIGYKEVVQHLLGKLTIDEAREQIKQNTRRYAKRQLTFLRGMHCHQEWIKMD